MIRSGSTTRSQPRGDTNGFSQAQRHLGNLSTISRLAGRRRPRWLKVRAARVCQGRFGRAVIQFDYGRFPLLLEGFFINLFEFKGFSDLNADVVHHHQSSWFFAVKQAEPHGDVLGELKGTGGELSDGH